MNKLLLLLKMEFRKSFSNKSFSVLIILLLCFSIFTNSPILLPMAVFFLTSSFYLTDNNNGFLELVTSLPVKRITVIKARYCHAIIISTFTCFIPLLGHIFDINTGYISIFPITFFMISLYTACNLPFILMNHRFASLMCVLGYLVMLGFAGAFTALLELIGINSIKFSLNMNFVSAVIFSGVVWIISYFASLILFGNVYVQKEDKI